MKYYKWHISSSKPKHSISHIHINQWHISGTDKSNPDVAGPIKPNERRPTKVTMASNNDVTMTTSCSTKSSPPNATPLQPDGTNVGESVPTCQPVE